MLRSLIISIFLLVFLVSCENLGKTRDQIETYLREPPVEPVANSIRISVPIGYFASVAWANLKGYPIPHSTIYTKGDLSIIHLEDGYEIPIPYLHHIQEEIIVASLNVSDNLLIMSIFFEENGFQIGNFRLYNVETIPVVMEDDRYTAVYANQDINISGSQDIRIEMGPMEIEMEISRLDLERPETEEIAIKQNAWIIDVFHHNTFGYFQDDDYQITGGEQQVQVGHYTLSSETSVLQMAIIEAKINSGCFHNPESGFALLREIELSTGPTGDLEDFVLGTVFFNFHTTCNGKVKIPLATGNFITATGKVYDLNLF